MSELIVGFGHVARVGKDVAADALCRDLGFVKVGFADQLRELAMAADPLVVGGTRTVNVGVGHGHFKWMVQGHGYEQAKDIYPEVRGFLQRLGQGAREVFGPYFWVEQWERKIEKFPLVVVPDVRYLNEAETIQAKGGVVVRINRPGRFAAGHQSELELADWDGWDEEFVNAGGIQDLQRDVVAYVKNQLQLRG